MEESLLKACLRGQARAQRRLYNQYFAYVLTVCLHYAPTREAAEEMAQNAFVRMFRRLDTFERRGNFRAWLRRLTVNCAIDYLRKYRRPLFLVEEFDPTLEPSEPNAALRQLEREDVLALLQQLPVSYRLVFNLFVLEEYTHPEIAEELGISVGTSKSNLSRARRKLRQLATTYLTTHQAKKYV